MKSDDDSVLIRFRIDKSLLEKAESTCQRHGHELFEVVRAMIAQVVRDDAIPVDIPPTGKPASHSRFDDHLAWDGQKTQISASVLLELIERVIARCSTRLAMHTGPANHHSDMFSKIRERAVHDRDTLDLTDQKSIDRALAAYKKLVNDIGGPNGV
ncbi:type II toxin-antitoxin system RelB/DinJ family antitoxin [Denitromonas iodatirespirans]|uniref:Type II toxin-antitoxin system RelB/DinJ family antitoxin n=1 Tax=Denitromonas iodatirespirans TaxID=2795389 RepID=A0A944DR16_DENI1|nr:type II toxin-antitoxin system RelB/DinJ family antitoxin [Denitromonas iodatirespirans]MBT0963019.1 type II toxin-antitoxin system RelB/DinJ family antitoxin [Denitromonas iodatirespirans]MCZ4307065.1 type II toxin-antitoxin system RelB/DinJ family antitoxin [Zoogloeaceae bacterium G21618-S1]